MNSVRQRVCVQLLSASSLPAYRVGVASRWQSRERQTWLKVASELLPTVLCLLKKQAHVADSKGKPTDTTKPVCKWCFKSVMTKRANTSNLVKHLADRHVDCLKSSKSCRLAIDNINMVEVKWVFLLWPANFLHHQSCRRQSGVKLTV